jgi:hypothetical protein
VVAVAAAAVVVVVVVVVVLNTITYLDCTTYVNDNIKIQQNT